MRSMKKVSVILLNWNSANTVFQCVESLRDQTYRDTEFILVDNNSTDGSYARLKEMPIFTRVIHHRENLGFARGMNSGIEVAAGDYIIPLNTDVFLHPEFIAECVAGAENQEGAGAVGGKILAWVRGKRLETIKNDEGGITYFLKRFQGRAVPGSDRSCLVFRPAGSCPCLSASMLKDLKSVSGFYYDGKYGSGWEDIDLFFRMQLRGWKSVYIPTALAWHVGSGSVGGDESLFTKPFEYQVAVLRNRYFTMLKDIPSCAISSLLLPILVMEAAITFYFALFRPITWLARCLAIWETVRNLPVLLQDRSRIQSHRRISCLQFKKLFHGF